MHTFSIVLSVSLHLVPSLRGGKMYIYISVKSYGFVDVTGPKDTPGQAPRNNSSELAL